MAIPEDFVLFSKAAHFEKEAKPYWKCACLIDNNDDTRRHHLMLDHGLSFLKGISISNCLSIGDSRARDAAYAKYQLGCYAIASDLNSSEISKAVSDGFVDDVADVDVERIPYTDSAFDLVIAKETFHHWPRPFLGLYEILRVSRKAIVLIEPYDCISGAPKPYIDENSYHDSYEEVGNYKYQISLREVIKASWALGLPCVAAKGFNDPYSPNRDFMSWKQEKSILDLKGESGERQFNLMAIVVFLDPDTAKQSYSLNSDKGRYYWRPTNPFVSQTN